MPLLDKGEISNLIDAGWLVLNHARDDSGNPKVEPASYDLRAGVVIWKEEKTSIIQQKSFAENDSGSAELITLKPGQMVFVITHEELKLPLYVAGTVYSRNKLQKENVLALNAGHVDPGYQGPIIIRLINLGAVPWTFRLGDAVFTVAFHTVMVSDGAVGHPARSKSVMVEAATQAARNAFSNPFHDLYEIQIQLQLGEHYSKVGSELRKQFADEFFRKNQVTQLAVLLLAAVFGIIIAVTKIPWPEVRDWFKANQMSVAVLFVIFAAILVIMRALGFFTWMRSRFSRERERM